jgi:hypothetical protein
LSRWKAARCGCIAAASRCMTIATWVMPELALSGIRPALSAMAGYDVRYVQNFTDIDDKILNRARLEGTSMEEVSERFIKAYFEDMARLNVKEADAYPRATHTLDGIKRLIYELEQKDFAYPAFGDVYYAVRQFSRVWKAFGTQVRRYASWGKWTGGCRRPRGIQEERPVILPCGRGQNRENLLGNHLGVLVVRVGILNARQ